MGIRKPVWDRMGQYGAHSTEHTDVSKLVSHPQRPIRCPLVNLQNKLDTRTTPKVLRAYDLGITLLNSVFAKVKLHLGVVLGHLGLAEP